MSKLINPIEKANPIFLERIRLQLNNEKDYEEFWKISVIHPVNSIRCNTIKISTVELKKRLEKKWEIKQPFPKFHFNSSSVRLKKCLINCILSS